MRTLNILCGISVLFSALAFGHIMHHHLMHAGHPGPAFWAFFTLAVVVLILSFIGGCLLLRRSR
jgi:hypothetical protein